MSVPDDNPDIAIIGLACRFPGARDAAEFWRNLAGGVESITRLSDEEIVQSGAPAAYLAMPGYVKAAPVLGEPGGFDAAFFGFTLGEARTMDPQHRILLELASEALEDAGCDPQRFPGRIGVFAGTAMNTYFMHAGLERKFAEEYIPTLIVNDKDFLSTRLSYKLNLKGPSVTLQTACSTSLVAVHFARQSLLTDETDIALAGAISVRVPHRAGYFADSGGVASPSGHVRAFDAAADGTIFGSGGGVLVLKRLRDALADGDTIRAVIKGSAINNDGSEKAGYTAPSVNGQADVVIEALANADVEADSISYVEAHGSGTPVGDPIEIRALTKAFRASTKRSGFCAIGSVKTNVGHLDAAAGMAGVIKTVLALQHRQIPASLNFSTPNPELELGSTPFFVNTHLAPWNSSRGPRRAGVMSTGMGGTNAHLIIEEAPSAPTSAESARPKLLLLSARTESALAASADRLRAFLELNPDINLEDAAFTLQTGRRAMEYRRFVVAANRAGAVASLGQSPTRTSVGRVNDGGNHSVILLLPGVGDHYVGMGRELYTTLAAFRREVDRCAEILRPLLGLDIREILYPKNRDWQKGPAGRGIDLKKMLAGNTCEPADADAQRLNQAVHLQPALFTIEYALAGLWSELGLLPQAIVGHSMGEYVAACLAGVFSLEDALRLIVRRTQLVDRLPPARMLAVTLPEAELQPLLPPQLSIALINGPNLCIVAGAPPVVEEFSRTLAARGVVFRAVQNTHAFHSRLLEPIASEFEAEVRKTQRNEPRIPFISNLTGKWIGKAEAVDPAYWAAHLYRTARVNDALRTLWQVPSPILLEAGPGNTLGVLAMQHPDRPKTENSTAISSLRHHYENLSDSEVFLNSAGRLWLAGTEIRWEKLYEGKSPHKVALPTYPFERDCYWLEPASLPATEASFPSQPATARDIDQWFYVPSWERTVFPADRQSSAAAEEILWLIFSARPENAASVCSHLPRATRIHLGQQFKRDADDSFEIDPTKVDDYLQVFREIKSRAGKSIHIIHLGCVAPPNVARNDRAQDLGFFSLLFIAQAIGEANITVPIRIGIVSTGIHEVIGNESLSPEMATVLGPCGVIPKEFPNIHCFNVDLPGDVALGDAAAGILAEFAQSDRGEVIAYRGRHRWKKTYRRVDLPTPEFNRLRNRGVYLITGGTGGIGLAVARYLANACKATLLLTKKAAFPEKSKWVGLLAADDTPGPVIKLIKELQEIESLGVQVEVMVAEASIREQMRDVFRAAHEKFGGINGVIHAAGIVRPGIAQARTRAIVESVHAPKVTGTWILHDLLADADLDFLVLCSSLTAVTTPFAESDYSGANAFLDAFAVYSRTQRSYPVISINWPGWKEAGQLVNLQPAAGTESWKESALEKAILTREGIEAFQRILSSNHPQVVVSPESLDRVLRQSHEPLAPSPDSTGARVFPRSTHLRRAPKAVADLPTDEVETTIAGLWSAVFGHSQIGIHEEFGDLGGHSLLALQIVTKIQAEYRVQLTLREFFEAPTIAQLSSLIRDKLIMDIANLSDHEVRQLISNGPGQHDQ